MLSSGIIILILISHVSQVGHLLTEEVQIRTGIRQGDSLSPNLVLP